MKNNDSQISLFKNMKATLPANYNVIRPDYFHVSRIYLTKGSMSTPERQNFVERICKIYAGVEIYECLDTPHNRIDLGEKDQLSLHKCGKNTLVFGELKTAVRFSEESGNTCPNYWHFSPYGFCPYGCKYCFLAGTQGVKLYCTLLRHRGKKGSKLAGNKEKNSHEKQKMGCQDKGLNRNGRD